MNDNDLTTNSIKQLLNQSVSEISAGTIASLRSARNMALQRHVALEHAPVLAWLSHHGLAGTSTSQKKISWALALILGMFLFGGISYMQQTQQHEHDHSEIDIAILTDDLPVDAYVEQ